MRVLQAASIYPAAETVSEASQANNQRRTGETFSSVVSKSKGDGGGDEYTKKAKEKEPVSEPEVLEDEKKEDSETRVDAVDYIISLLPQNIQTQAESPTDVENKAAAETEPEPEPELDIRLELETGVPNTETRKTDSFILNTNNVDKAGNIDNTAETAETAVQSTSEEMINTENTDSTPFDQQTEVVSILEGNKPDTDIVPRRDETANVNTPAGETARMPQETAPIEAVVPVSEVTDTEETNQKSGEKLCPLENENEIEQQDEVTTAQKPQEQDSGSQNYEGEETTFSQSGSEAQTRVDIAPDKAMASAQLQGAVLEPQGADASPERVTQVRTNELFETMIEKIQMSSSADSSQLEIQLRPEHLGKVTIALSLSEGGLQAKINAESPEIRALINSQITQLTEALSEKGIKISAVEVTYTGVADHAFDQSHKNGESRQDEQSRARLQRLQRLNGYAAASILGESEGIPDDGLSSVEYRA